MNNKIPQKLRLIATGSHTIGGIAFIIFILLIYQNTFAMLGIILLTVQPAIVGSYWAMIRNIHPFVDRSGRDAFNCAVNTVIGTIVSILFCTFIFSVTWRVGSQDPTLFYISLFILSCVELAYFMNSVIAGIFAFRGYRLKSRLIYPFLDVS